MQTIELITGSFSPEEAKLILSGLINHKINFHYMKNFSSEQRFGIPVSGSQERIESLKEARSEVFSIIEKAIQENRPLKINSNIIISLD